MTVSNQRIFVPGSQTKNWRPWGLDILSVFAHVGAIRWPNLGDFDRWPLPATPELTEIVSGLQAYHRLHTVRRPDDPTGQSVLARIGDVANAAVDCLRKQGVDLLWRIEPKPDAPTQGSPKLNAALAIVHYPRRCLESRPLRRRLLCAWSIRAGALTRSKETS